MPEVLIGIDVGGSSTKMLVVDPAFNVVGECSLKTQPSLGYDIISDRMISLLDKLFNKPELQGKKVAAIGMGLPGIVDTLAQKTVYLSYVKWDGFNPCEKIARHFNTSCIIDNDANVHALGEYYFGLNKKVKDITLIALGTGIGCGVVTDGEIYHGASNLATELGHMTIVADGGETCLCGQKGHLEAYCSGTALTNYSIEMMGEHKETVLHHLVKENGGVFTNDMVDKGLLSGDEVCKHIWERFVHYLAVGCGNVMKLFNPEVILLGGGISNAGAILLEPLNREVAAYVIHPKQRCPIKKARLGDKAGMFGACALAASCAGWQL